MPRPRGIADGDTRACVENGRGWCELRAVVTDGVRPGVRGFAQRRWSKLSGGRNVNWTTPDALGDHGRAKHLPQQPGVDPAARARRTGHSRSATLLAGSKYCILMIAMVLLVKL